MYIPKITRCIPFGRAVSLCFQGTLLGYVAHHVCVCVCVCQFWAPSGHSIAHFVPHVSIPFAPWIRLVYNFRPMPPSSLPPTPTWKPNLVPRPPPIDRILYIIFAFYLNTNPTNRPDLVPHSFPVDQMVPMPLRHSGWGMRRKLWTTSDPQGARDHLWSVGGEVVVGRRDAQFFYEGAMDQI